MLPVLWASQRMAILTGTRRKMVQAMQTSRIHIAVRPEPAFTSATLRASRVQPMMSFPTPAESAMIPTCVSSNLNSIRTRQRTGNAVMEYATPVKSMKWLKWTEESMKWWYKGMERRVPRPNGRAIPAKDTITDMRALRLMTPMSISRPTMNKNRQRPISATRERYGRDTGGKMCSVKPGILPNAVGPEGRLSRAGKIT